MNTAFFSNIKKVKDFTALVYKNRTVIYDEKKLFRQATIAVHIFSGKNYKKNPAQ